MEGVLETSLRRARMEEEAELRRLLRERRKRLQSSLAAERQKTFGERAADAVAEWIGSWTFILIQSALFAAWLTVNALWAAGAWDRPPYILLNLLLSFQAAYTGPILLISANRQANIDRQKAENDYQVNVKAELEIEGLHQKMDALREQEVADLVEETKRQTEIIARLEAERHESKPKC